MKLMECAVRDVIYGANVRVIKPVNIYKCELRDDVFVSPFVEIQKSCVIGSGSRIQSHTFIRENVTLRENYFIGYNVIFANDLFRSGAPDPSPDNWTSITLGDSITVDSGAIILSPYICSRAIISAEAVVVKPIGNKGIYAGDPARLIKILRKKKGPLLALFIRGRSVSTAGVQKSTAGDRFPGPPDILRQ